MGSLANRKVLVVGGTSGIGLATALLADKSGASVFAVSRSGEKVARCAAAYSGIDFSVADIHDAPGLAALLDAIAPVDHIVAAATGAKRTMAPFMAQTDAEFRGAFDKFWGYARLARQGIARLSDQGSLTFVSGTPARKCNPGMSSVSCTGGAVEGLTRALALEIAPKRVNAVAPGLIDTAMFDHLGDNRPAALEKMGESILLGRIGQAQEVASAILLLMTNAYMTGVTIDVDGGLLLP